MNLNDGLHLGEKERGEGWISVVEQFKEKKNFQLSQYLWTSLPTFQQIIKFTGKYECNNTFLTNFKYKSHANVSTLPKINS